MKRVVSVLAALLSIVVPASGSPFVPASRNMADSLELMMDAVH